MEGEDQAASSSGTWISGDTWLLNLTALTEGLQGVNLTEGVNLQGWVLNITALVEDLPLSQYVPRGAAAWYQIVITLVCLAFSTRWFLNKYEQHRCAREGVWVGEKRNGGRGKGRRKESLTASPPRD